MYYIYEIYNDVTQRRYIGLTLGWRSRFYGHLVSLRTKKHTAENMVADYVKYGEEHFSFRLLDTAPNKKEGYKKETKYMHKYKTYVPEYGYNGNDPRWNRKYPTAAIADSDLRRRIKAQGYHLSYIPYVLNITYKKFVQKMNNPEMFTEKELTKLNEFLELSSVERWNQWLSDHNL